MGSGRRQRGVDDVDVRGLDVAGHVGLLLSGEDAVGQLLARLEIPLQGVVGRGAPRQVEGLGLGGVQGRPEARFLVGGHVVVVLGGAHQAPRFQRDLLARAVHLLTQSLGFGVLAQVALGLELGTLPLQVGQLGAQRLDQRASDRVRQLLRVGGRAHLLVEGRLLQAARLGRGERSPEVLELLLDESPPLLEVHEARFLLESLEGVLGRLDLLGLLGRLVGEPGPGLGRDAVAELEGLLDVGLDHGVGGARGQVRPQRFEGHDHHLTVLDGLDAQPFLEGLDGTRGELGVVLEAETLHHAPGQEATLQEAELGLVVVLGGRVAGPGVAVEIEHVRDLALDEDLGPGLVDGLGEGDPRHRRPQARHQHGQGQPATTHHDMPVVAQVGGLRCGAVVTRKGFKHDDPGQGQAPCQGAREDAAPSPGAHPRCAHERKNTGGNTYDWVRWSRGRGPVFSPTCLAVFVGCAAAAL